MSTEGTAAPHPGPSAETGDRVGFRLAVFAAVLVVAASVGFGIGRLTGPPSAPGDSTDTQQPNSGAHSTGQQHGHEAAPAVTGESVPHAHGTETSSPPQAGEAGGLSLSSAGLTLVPESTTFRAGVAQPLRFRIAGSAGTVTTFAVVHEKAMHLIVVRRDLTGYQHLHPVMAADGTWSVPLALGAPGTWRAYADFTALVGDRQTPATLGVDLSVPGAYLPRPLPPAANTAAVHEFGVSYAGALQVGSTQPLLVRVTGAADGLAPLEPYLGAYGHLVVIREGDLGYLHVHPEPQLVDGAVKFWLAAPSPGRYRMFFDFQVAGKVHTAAFTTTVP